MVFEYEKYVSFILCSHRVAPLHAISTIKAQAKNVMYKYNINSSKKRFSLVIPTEQREYGISKCKALGNNMSIYIRSQSQTLEIDSSLSHRNNQLISLKI